MALKEGKEKDRTMRLMVIGCYGQGKTTLTRRLLNQTLEGVESTNGVDIHKASCTQEEKFWECMKEENVEFESLERLAKISVVQNVEKTSRNKQEWTEVIYTRVQPADSTESATEKISQTALVSLSSSSDNLTLHKHTDLQLFQKIKQDMQGRELDKKWVISLWDFAGQFVFYSTHQLFHSRNAIYLLVFDLHKNLDAPVKDEDYPGGTSPLVKSMKDYLEFWVTSVHSFVGSRDATQPKIILVGTHKDKLKDEKAADDYFEAVKKMFDGRKLLSHIYPQSFAIAGKDLKDDTVAQLRETIIRIGNENKEEIPARWIPLEIELRKKEHKNVLKFKEVLEINRDLEQPIWSEDQIKAFLKFHHTRGTFIYFDEGLMAENVVVNPPYVVDAFRCIITSGRFCKNDNHLRPLWQKLTSHAVLEQELIHAVWENDHRNKFIEFKDVLLLVLQRHKIIAEAHKFNEESQELTPLGFFIVSSFLRKSRGTDIAAFLKGRNYTPVSFVYKFEHEAIVSTIYQRVTSAAIGSWSVVDFNHSKLLFEDAGVYRLNISYAGIIIHNKNTIDILVVHMCPRKEISSEIPDFFRRFVDNVIRSNSLKLVPDERENNDVKSYRNSIRCYHSDHNCEGSVETYDLEMLKNQQEKEVCCPDNLAHDSIDIKKIFHLWFSYKVSDKVIPHRRLELKELVELSFAIGYNWELLGTLLDISEIKIQHIIMDNKDQKTSMKIYEMLKLWDSEREDEATLDILVRAIEKLPKESVNLDVIKNLIDKIY